MSFKKVLVKIQNWPSEDKTKMFKRENRKEKKGQRLGVSGILDKVKKPSKENGMMGS